MSDNARPVSTSDRIQSLDVLRGFAVLGILLLNILGFGLHNAGYFNPLIAIGETASSRSLNLGVWAAVNVLFEGAMRCLFSLLFGAGVVLFATGRVGAGWLHYKRTFWLFVFGVLDVYVLLWWGDILIVYALSGVILYLLRNRSPRSLLVIGAMLLVLIGVITGGLAFFLEQARTGGAVAWTDFEAQFNPAPEAYAAELSARRGSYASAFMWNVHHMQEAFVFFPLLILDALAMMIPGMALFKLGVLDATRSLGWYVRLAASGFAVGLLTNFWELGHTVATDFDTLATMPIMVPTYQLGRLGMALGYLGIVMIVCRLGALPAARRGLAAVGRMALTNYLMHSAICAVLFTGIGFGLVGELERWQLYPVVIVIWAFQLWFSPWWLDRHSYGPAEWLWRALTYGARPMSYRLNPN